MNSSDGENSRFSVLLIVGVVSVVISLCFSFYYEPKSLGLKILFASIAELGFACMIAYAIIYFVDKNEKREFREYIQINERRFAMKATMSYLLDMELPKSISDEIEGFIIQSNIVKKYSKAELSLNLIDGYDEYIYFRQDIEYLAYNASSIPIKQEIPYFWFAPKGIPDELKKMCLLEKLTIERKNPKSGQFELVGDLSFENKLMQEDFVLEGSLIELKPMEEIRVRIVSTMPKNTRDGYISYNFNISENFEFDIRYDTSLFEVEVMFMHAKPDSLERIEHNGGSRWRSPHPLLPGNGFYATWRKV